MIISEFPGSIYLFNNKVLDDTFTIGSFLINPDVLNCIYNLYLFGFVIYNIYHIKINHKYVYIYINII